MGNTPCTLKHITLIEVAHGIQYSGPVNMEGLEVEPGQGQAVSEEDKRSYFCSNCLVNFDGSDTFDVCKSHLGTFPSV